MFDFDIFKHGIDDHVYFTKILIRDGRFDIGHDAICIKSEINLLNAK